MSVTVGCGTLGRGSLPVPVFAHICLSDYEVNFLKEFDLRFCLAVF